MAVPHVQGELSFFMEAHGERSVTTRGVFQLPMTSASIWTVELRCQYQMDSPLEEEIGLSGTVHSAVRRMAHTRETVL